MLTEAILSNSRPHSHHVSSVPVSLTPHLHSQPIVLKESRLSVLFKTVLSGVGFCSDAYDLFIMNVVLVVIGCSDPDPNQVNKGACLLSSGNKSLLATAVLVGSICGQLLFGVLADYLGRRRGFIATLSILIVGAILSSASMSSPAFSLFTCLAVTRFILGVGVGGEYPLSATVSSEASVQTAGRGRRVAAVFSMQGVGLLLAPSVILLLLCVVPADDYDLVWRLALGLGGAPGLVMLYFRFRMKETAAFSAQGTSSVDTGEKWRDLCDNKLNLLATTGSWFIFDVVFYANSLFSSEITKAFISPPSSDSDVNSIHSYLISVSLSTLFLAICALPGYIGATLVIDRWGRRNLQLFGFLGMTFAYILCGLCVPYMQQYQWLFYIIYGLSFFFCNMGPNTTTFVIPAELFPTNIRASAHGTSAAAGKLGAAVGTALMPTILQSGLPTVLYTSAGIAALGLLWTFFLTVESKQMSVLLGDEEQEVIVEEGEEDEEATSPVSDSGKPEQVDDDGHIAH